MFTQRDIEYSKILAQFRYVLHNQTEKKSFTGTVPILTFLSVGWLIPVSMIQKILLAMNN